MAIDDLTKKPKVVPVGDVPAATAKAAMPKPIPAPAAQPVSGSAQTLAAPPQPVSAPLTNAATLPQRALPAPPNFIAGPNGVQANTPSAGFTTSPGAAPPSAAAQLTAPPVQAPNLTTSPGATTPTAYDPPMPTRATVVQPSATGGSSLSLVEQPARTPLSLAPQPLALEPGPVTAAPASAPADPVYTRPGTGGPKVDASGTISPDDFAQRTRAARAASAKALSSAPANAMPPPSPLPGVSATVAGEAASDVGRAATLGERAASVAKNALGGSGSVLRKLGVAGTAIMAAKTANEANNAYHTTRDSGGSVGDASLAAAGTAGKGAFTLGSTLTGAEIGAQLGSRVPGPPIVRSGATLAGGLIGGIAGGVGGDKLLSGLPGAGNGEVTPYRDLGPGVYSAGGTEVPMFNAKGEIAKSPTNVDVLALQKAGSSPEAQAAFDAQFGKGRAAEFAKAYVPPAPEATNSAAALTQPPVNFITPETNGAISPPDANGVSLQGADQAMKSNLPGTAVINGRVVSAEEIKALENRNVVSSDAFTNVAPGVLHSAATGGGTLTQDQAVASRVAAATPPKFGTDANGNPVGTTGAGIGGPAATDRQGTITKLMSDIRDALRNGKRGNARLLISQLSAFDAASGGDANRAQAADAAGRGKAQTPAEQALEAAQASDAQLTLKQRQRLESIQQKLAVETDPAKRKTLQQDILSLSGKAPESSADKLITLKIPRQVGIGEAPQNIEVPYDPVSNQLRIPDGYAQLLGLLGSQPQAKPQK